MKLVPGKDFWQSSIGERYEVQTGLENKAGGVCFRVACKWLLCKIYNKNFLTYDAKMTGRIRWEQTNDSKSLTGWKRTDFNVVSTINKQMDYLAAIAPYEKPGTDYSVFLYAVIVLSKQQIETWGTKIGKYSVSARYHSCAQLENEERLKKDGTFIIGIAGTSQEPVTKRYGVSPTASSHWAHAFAFYRNGKEVRFFDSNGGEYQIEEGEDAGTAIQGHATAFYSGYEKVYGFEETPFGNTGAKQFQRNLKDLQFRKIEDGFKSIRNYLLFEVTKK